MYTHILMGVGERDGRRVEVEALREHGSVIVVEQVALQPT